jgi:tetratricopeptide (TPR) repeat protein
MKSIPVRQMMKSLRPAAAVAFCLAGILPVASAQPLLLTEDAAVKRALGSGLHAFFGCDYQQAYDDLTEVVAAGSLDPRALYFRGLAARRMGRIDEAEADFSEAARLEAAAIGQWPVSQTLERVQGQDRLALERHRIRGRMAGIQAGREAELRRYSDLETTQDTYLRRRRPAVLERDPAAPFRTEELIPPPPVTPNPPPALDLEPEPEPEMEDAEDGPAERVGGDPFGAGADEAASAADAPGDEVFEE